MTSGAMNNNPTILGVDPGLSGALSWLDAETGRLINVVDMPVQMLPRGGRNKRDIDVHALARLIADRRPDHAFIEQVASMPRQGVASTFSFGKAYGIAIGILVGANVPISFVTPLVWKRSLAVPKAKAGARSRASQLMPMAAHLWSLVKHDGRAESVLIGMYGRKQLGLPVLGSGQPADAEHAA